MSDEAALEEVLISDVLASRRSGPVNLAAENQALRTLAQTASNEPDMLLQRLVELCVNLCKCDSAGISIIEGEGDSQVFRWYAIAGDFAPNVGGSMPRENSPCGVVVDRGTACLFDRPARYFPDLRGTVPVIFENLLVPFGAGERTLGTVWAIAQTPDRQFDAEDARLLSSLSQFAAAGYYLSSSLQVAVAERQQFEQRVRIKDELLGIISHELRGPLTVIRGSVDRLARTARSADEPARERLFSEIGEQAHRLESLVENMLALSREDLGTTIELEPLLLQRLLPAAIEAERAGYPDRDIVLHVPESVGPVLGSPAYVVQIIHNLVSNASKYSEPGGPIEVRVEETGKHVAVRVLDHGEQFSDEQVDAFMEPFIRGEYRREDTAGTGLGMSVCSRLAAALGGELRMQPRAGGGIEASFTLRTAEG